MLTPHALWKRFLPEILEGYYPKRLLLILGLATLFINLLSLVFPLALLQSYDRVIPNQAVESLSVLIMLVLGALVFEVILRVCRILLSSWADSAYQTKASQYAFEHLLKVPLNEYQKLGSGFHFERLNALNNFKNYLSGQAVITTLDFLFLIIFLIIIFMISAWLVLVPLSIIGLYLWIGQKTNKGLREDFFERRRLNNLRSNFLLDTLNGMHTLKAMALEPAMFRRFEKLQNNLSRANNEIGIKLINVQISMALLAQVLIIAVAIVGGILVINGQVSLGGLAASILLSTKCLQPVAGLVRLWNRLQALYVSKDSITNLFAMPTESANDANALDGLKGGLELKDLSLIDQLTQKPILNKINLKASVGEFIVINTNDNYAKNRLFALLRGTVQPNSGEILYDGNNYKQFAAESIRESITYLPPNGRLFKGSILQNLAHFQGRRYHERAKSIAKHLGLHQTITLLPEGYDTQVGGKAIEHLPMDLKQMLMICQAMLEKPKLIILHDTTDYLNKEGTANIIELLKKLKGECTIIATSSNKQIQGLADKTYQLQQGVLS